MYFLKYSKTYLIDYLLRFTWFIDMFDTLLIITLFLRASLLVCLLTLRLRINIKRLCLFFHSLLILKDHPPPPIYFDTLPPRLLILTKISDLPVYFDPRSPSRLLST